MLDKLNNFVKSIEENKIESDIKYLFNIIRNEEAPIKLRIKVVSFLCDSAFTETFKEEEVKKKLYKLIKEFELFLGSGLKSVDYESIVDDELL